ncbi:MAG: hypothetical protein D6753_12550 [Planctomycetota bacterium]|nr:MAG: hypothetical protein D6753_12550 [Planctomycetota bacterium]
MGVLLIAVGLLGSAPCCHAADDWMTWASTYTHDPATGQRVDQYAEPRQPLGPDENAVRRSGFRHYRSTLQAGLSSDNFHVVEKWGEEIIPYEHWRFPYRPYGVPYQAWGPPTPYGLYYGIPPYGYGYPAPYPGTGASAGGGTGGGTGGTSGVGGGLSGGSAGPAGNPYAWPGGGIGRPFFPLQPQYRNQPWYDGTYPPAAPLDRRTDAEFFYHPPLGRPTP